MPTPPPPCTHKHLQFRNQGAVLKCIDCPRLYHIVMPQIGVLYGGVPDVGYANAGLSDMETRHTMLEAPRTQPLPAAPVVPPPAKRPRVPAPVQKKELPPEPLSQKARRLLRRKRSL